MLARALAWGALDWNEDEVRKLFEGYLPSDDTVRDWKVTWLEESRALVDVYTRPPPGMVELTEPLSHEEMKRMRYARSYQPAVEYRGLGERWGRGISLACEGLSVFKFFVLAGNLHKYTSAGTLYQQLDKLSKMAKKGGTAFHSSWFELVNGETLGGYLQVIPEEDYVETIRAWVTGSVTHSIGGDEALFDSFFREGVREFLNDMPNLSLAQYNCQTLSEWVRYPGNWARAGSSTEQGSGTYLDRDGEERKPRKSKWRTALHLHPKEVESRIRTGSTEQHPRLIQKRETGKIRAVVGSDDLLYWRMSYLITFFETALLGNGKSTLFMSSTQLLDMWVDMIRRNKCTTWKMPIDQDKFDHNQSWRQLEIIFDEMYRIIVRDVPKLCRSDMLLTLRQVRESVTTQSKIKVGNYFVTVMKGILSGWRLTSFLDSVANYGTMYTGREVSKLMLVPGWEVKKEVCTGDDTDPEYTTAGFAISVSELLKHMNFGINPGKFFLSQDRNEFLRQRADKKVVVGYPLRAINSILWRNPISRDPAEGFGRMSEQLLSWELLFTRGYDRTAGKVHMYKDGAWKLNRIHGGTGNTSDAGDIRWFGVRGEFQRSMEVIHGRSFHSRKC